MVETQIAFVVVGHHERREQAAALAGSLGAHLLIDEEHHGANWNHRRAMEYAAKQSQRVVVLEDDAVPVAGFSMVGQWLDMFPEHLISFYLGTGRPPQYQMEIAVKLIAADRTRQDYIEMHRLIHGVCYSMPRQHIPKVLAKWDSKKAADYAVGDAYGGQVIYPCQSLVDHADGIPVERAKDGLPRNERRRAWRLYG
ncbi:hypothetical protein CLM71_08710 [Serratia sp. MYb239]|uniref:hypothetical protein n=1 Tax=Serratia sp. MYb239 TaxID=2033438 RepID=UPI000CF67B72|nr:hypothetical protein [Serratia sp. MYb239]AVJ17206.1 hypothetical protein CLM71_08710 [Serratia sp. MYb239]